MGTIVRLGKLEMQQRNLFNSDDKRSSEASRVCVDDSIGIPTDDGTIGTIFSLITIMYF